MKKGALFKTVRVILVLAAAIGIAAALLIMRPQAERQEISETGRLVEVFIAGPESLAMAVEAYGTVTPREALNLVAEVKGQILALDPAFAEGGAVSRELKLITIEPETYHLEVQARAATVRQIQAELKRLEQEKKNLHGTRKLAKSDASLGKAEFDRLKTLTSRKVVSRTNRDKAEQRYLASLDRLQSIDNQIALIGPRRAQLLAQRDLADVRRRQAELDLERTRIVAPFDGWVLDKAVETGQHVAPGQYLGRIYRSGALDIEVRIPTRDLKWLPPDFSTGNMPRAVVTSSDAGRDRTWPGRVARVMAKMEEKTRTLPMIVEVEDLQADGRRPADNSPVGPRLRPGMFVTIRIEGRRFDGVFVVPRHVVQDDGTVYLVRGNRLSIQPVNVLRRFKDVVYVDQGMSEGDRVIVTPLSDAREGMKIRVKNR